MHSRRGSVISSPDYCKVIKASNRYCLKTSTFNECLFLVVLSGIKKLKSSSGDLTAAKGQGFLIAKGARWEVENIPGHDLYYSALAVGFSHEDIKQNASRIESVKKPSSPKVVNDVTQIVVDAGLLHAVQRALPPQISSHYEEVLLDLTKAEILCMLAGSGFQFPFTAKIDWADRVRRIVSQKPQHFWSSESVARALNVSESTLRRRISGCGFSLVSLVRDARLDFAISLLQSSDMQIGEVANRSGWRSHSRFTDAFHKKWGLLPSEVRYQKAENA